MRWNRVVAATLSVGLIAGCATDRLHEQARAQRADEAAYPAPPPPPPPPSPVMNAPVMVTGSTVAGARYVSPVVVPSAENRERYDGKEVNPVHVAATDPVSTFSVDVDTGAYANSRRFLVRGQLPPRDAVRTEELINYFRYDYPAPQARSAPFSVTTDVMATPWNAGTYLMRIGLKGYDLPRNARPPANLVFLVDVSGSMGEPDKLPLVKTALAGLAGELRAQDKVSIVVYAGAAGLVLPATNDPG